MSINQKIISFDLKAEMGFFKKPDINDGIYLTYNMLHKPALLGILGAIVGLRGYQENGVFPDYYNVFKNLKVGIEPLDSDKGNYSKEILSYNNGTGFASHEDGGNLIVTEQILLNPKYRCYLLLDFDNQYERELYDDIMNFRAEFLPYMGKNDFSAWWENPQEYPQAVLFSFDKNYKIVSLFSKTEAVKGYVVKKMQIFAKTNESSFLYFEKLPIGFEEELLQYEYSDFVYSNATFDKGMDMSANGKFYEIKDNIIIQLF